MSNWAVKDAVRLTDSPLKNVKKPPRKRRNRVLTPVERTFVFQTIPDNQFREYVFALLDTGCRPGEVMAVTANHVSRDGTRWTFDEHKTDRTGEARVVYLSPAMQALTRKLVALYPRARSVRTPRYRSGSPTWPA
jgi:integrase